MDFSTFGIPVSIVTMSGDQIKVSKLGITSEGKFRSVATDTDQASQSEGTGQASQEGSSSEKGESPAKPAK